MRKIKLHHPTERLLVFIMLMIIALLVSVLWFFGDRINILWQQNQAAMSEPMSPEMKFYIQTAMKSLYNLQPVTDVAQQRVYFPEAKIYVPLSAYARTVVYRYTEAEAGVPAGMVLTSNFNTNILPGTFEDVPCLQRHVEVAINDKSSFSGDFVKTVRLADGRTLNLYRQDSKSCSDEKWSQGSPDKLTALLEQAKSY